jgi:ribosomal protein L16 Arg81 hydroxylase
MIESLKDLISPVTLKNFFEQYWEKKPLFVRRNDLRFYQSLIDFSDLDALMAVVRPNERQVLIGKVEKDSADFFEYITEPQKFWATVTTAFDQGYTFGLLTIEQVYPKLRKFYCKIEDELGSIVSGSIYISPPNTQGFAAHCDRDDVYAMQIWGKKRWEIWQPLDELSLNGGRLSAEDLSRQGLPVIDVWLEPGDLLYVPRGWIHRVSSGDSVSMHSTLVPDACTWRDLLLINFKQVLDHHVEFRRGLPPNFMQLSAAQLESKLKCLLQLTIDKSDFEAPLRSLKETVINKLQLRTDSYFSQLGKLHLLTLDTQVTKRYRQSFSYTLTEDTTHVKLSFPGNKLALPVQVLPCLNFIAHQESFCPREIPLNMEENIKVQFVKDLIKAGFLLISEQFVSAKE